MKKSLLSFALFASFAVASFANEYTFVFDGTNDINGLQRQTSTKEADLTFVQEWSLTESGINFAIKKVGDHGQGFALINAGGTNAGLCVFSSGFKVDTFTYPEITMSVDNGKISALKFYMSGPGLNSLDLNFNETVVEAASEGTTGIYSWTWTPEEEAEQVVIDWVNNYYAKYIHSIEVTYSVDLQGKEECGLSFNSSSVEAFIGEENEMPVLSNPNNLPLTWASSEESVATVDNEGKVTLLNGGRTFITVSTDGNDAYAAGNARYELIVVPVASNFVHMKELAPNQNDRVKVKFPATVTYATGGFAFALDPDGNAGYINNIKNQGSTSSTTVTIYKVGEIIPEGWIATNSSPYETCWEGIPPAVEETTEVTYPEVESVTPADVYRVVILKDVTFTKPTPALDTKGNGTTPDGTSYEFQGTYNVPSQPAGTYNVTGIVRYSVFGSTVYFYISPLSYEAAGSGVEEIEAADSELRYYNLQGVEVANPKSGVFVKVGNGKAEKVLIK